MAAPRPLAERIRDSLAALAAPEADGWVATASADGTGYLVPLSLGWTGISIVLVTMRTLPTAVNLRLGTTVRVGIGPTRDVTLVEAEVAAIHPVGVAPTSLTAAFATQSGWDPAAGSDVDRYDLFELRPVVIQAWREANEIAGRTLMRNGVWLADSA